MARVYLDLRDSAVGVPPAEGDILKANKCLMEGIKVYDRHVQKSGQSAVRIETRIDWWKSLVCYRLYQIMPATPPASSTQYDTIKSIQLDQARFYCERSGTKLKESGYSDRSDIAKLFDRINQEFRKSVCMADLPVQAPATCTSQAPYEP